MLKAISLGITINGTEITNDNLEEYFEIEQEMVKNLTVNE